MAWFQLGWRFSKSYLLFLLQLSCQAITENLPRASLVHEHASVTPAALVENQAQNKDDWGTAGSFYRGGTAEGREERGAPAAIRALQRWARQAAIESGQAVAGDTADRAAMDKSSFDQRRPSTVKQTSAMQETAGSQSDPGDHEDDERELVKADGPHGGWMFKDDPQLRHTHTGDHEKGAELEWVPDKVPVPETVDSDGNGGGYSVDKSFGEWKWVKNEEGEWVYEFDPKHKAVNMEHGRWSWTVPGSGGKYETYIRDLRESELWPLGHLEQRWNKEGTHPHAVFVPIEPDNKPVDTAWPGVPKMPQIKKWDEEEKQAAILRRERKEHDKQVIDYTRMMQNSRPLPAWKPLWTPPNPDSPWHSFHPPSHPPEYHPPPDTHKHWNQVHHNSHPMHQGPSMQIPMVKSIPGAGPSSPQSEEKHDHDWAWNGISGYGGNVGYLSKVKLGTWERGKLYGHEVAAHHAPKPSQMHVQHIAMSGHHDSYGMQVNNPYAHSRTGHR